MELECDLSKINNEELLRKMWQQSENASRKKEIRSQLYKLRESRLRDLYQGEIMADNSLAGFGKDPLATSHGDALADQSFQSLKSKEIRDSLSPTEMKFQSMALNNPNTTGWNVQSSKEVSPDGRGFRAETLATTDGVESINGGTAEFKGRNEQRSSAHHQGDDKNFIKKAMESSNSHLQEKVVVGDENSGRTEVRTSSSTSTSSSQVVQSSTNVEYDDGSPIQASHPQKYLTDSNRLHHQDLQKRQQQEEQRLLEEQRLYEQQLQQQRQHHVNQQERRTTEQLSTTRQNMEKKNISQNVQTQETHEQNKHYVDMDKASPEYQQHVQYLMQQAGEIISNTVEYPKPNVKMITTVKRLPDGTIVRNKRYETEELTPTTPTTRSTSNAPNQTQPRRDSQHQDTRNYQPDTAPHSRPNQDMVDSSSRYIHDSHIEDAETKFSSVKKSSSKFSTETTSETTQEFDDHHPHEKPSSRPKPVTNDFSTHGFPSVRSNKPTQEYPTESPHLAHPTQGYPSQSTPSRPMETVVPKYSDDTDNISERRINTKDGEVIIVSSEKKRNYKTSTNSERIVEAENIIHDDQTYQQFPDKTAHNFTTHGFPSVREPTGSQQSKNYPSDRQMQPNEQDFPLDKFSPGTRIIKIKNSPHGDDDVVVVSSSQKSRTAKHSTNTERVIEHEIIRDDKPGGYPRSQPIKDNSSPYNYTVTTPGDQTPQGEFPGSSKKPTNAQGFPSVRTPGHSTPGHHVDDYPTKGYVPSRPAAGLPSSHNQHPSNSRTSPSQDYSSQGFPSVRSPTKGTSPQGYPSNVNGSSKPSTNTQPRTPSPNKYKPTNSTVRETTERVIRKEKEVDSAHRAFAASLRSSSPIDHVRRDSYITDSHTRHTPRSSVSSTKTFRRDMREGSHDSAPSETSRISTSTITRNTPPRNVGGRNVVTKVVTTKTGPGSNDTLNVTSPRGTKSPSPGKTVTTTTTTTTRTLTSKDAPKVTDNQHTRITTNNIDTIFPINEPPLTSITKNKFSDNYKQPHKKPKNISTEIMPVALATTANTFGQVEEAIEAPCLRKNYYKLGPSDQPQTLSNTTTFQTLKSPPIFEKSPIKKQSSQPAPSSRSSTPSYNSSRKPPTSVMADDYDDANQLRTTSPFSPPSSRSRTPQKFAPNVNDKPQDDWQKPRQPDDDERRTVNRETTFEKNVIEPTQPSRKPNFDQPNVEWVIVDDVDDYEHSDDSFAPEVVDSKINVKKTTTKLITQEKQTPLVPQMRSKPSTTTTVTTKQFKTIPNSTQAKTNDKSPLKTKPNDTRTPQTNKRQKPLIDARSSVTANLKAQPKNVDNKPVTKGPKSTVPSYTSPLKKPLPKNTTEETALRKTLKTSQVLKEKTTKLIEVEKNKTRPQRNDGKTKPQTPSKRKPSSVEEEQNIVITEIINAARDKTDDELILIRPSHKQPSDTDDKPSKNIPGFRKPQETNYEQGSPRFSTDDTPHKDTPGYRKSPSSYDEPNQFMPGYRKPEETPQGPLTYKNHIDTTNEPQQGFPDFQKSLYPDNESNQQFPSSKKPLSSEHPRQTPVSRKPLSSGFKKLQGTFDERSPHFGKPYDFDEPNQDSPVCRAPSYEKPEDTDDDLINYRPGRQSPQQVVTEQIKITETSLKTENEPQRGELEPSSDTPFYRKPQNTKEPYHGLPDHSKPQNHYTSDYGKPYNVEDEPGFAQPEGTDDEPSQGSPASKMPKQTYEEDVTITETSRKRFTEKETPTWRPQNVDSKPTQHTPESKIPFETDVEPNQGKPRTLDHRKPSQPLETEDVESFTESHILNTQKTVSKHIQKFEKNYLQNHSPKPQKTTKSPTKEPLQTQKKLPKTPVKETSPSRTQTKPQPVPTGRPKENKTIPEKPLKTNECETVVKTTEIFLNQKKPDQKFPEERYDTVSKTTKPVSPTQTQRMPVDDESLTVTLSTRQVVTKEILDKEYPKETEPVKKSGRPESKQKERKPLDTDEDETVEVTSEYITQKRFVNEKQVLELEDIKYPDKKTSFEGSPNREISPTRPTVKVPHSPNKHTSPTRSQKKPEQITPTEPSDKRPKSPNKNVSPTRTQKKPADNESFTTSLKTTTVAKDKKVTKEFDNAKYTEHKPKGRKPAEPLDAENNEPLIETNEFIANSFTKRLESEQQIIEYVEPSYPADEILKQKPEENIKSSVRQISPTRTPKKPGQKLPEKSTEPLSQSPSKAVSPTRTQKKPVENSPEKPIEKRPRSPNKHISPTRTQKKPDHTLPVDDRTLRKTLRSTDTVKEKIIRKNGDMDYPKEPEAQPKGRAPNAGPTSDTEEDDTITETSEFVVNSTQQILKTTKHIPKIEEKPHHPNSQNIAKSPIRGVSPNRSQSKPSRSTSEDTFEEPTGENPQSSTKFVLVGKKPLDDDESFTTLVATTKIVKERVTQEEDGAEYPHTRPKGRTPQNKPLKPDEYETFVETTEKLITTDKHIQEFKENSYPHKNTPQQLPVREVSPTGTKKKPGPLSPQDPKFKEPSSKRPQSPKKHVSPTRVQQHPDDKEEIFKTSLRTTKTVTKKVEEEECPDKRKPYEKKPNESKEHSGNPSDTAEKPGKQTPSFTRSPKKPVDDDESFIPTSITTTKKVIEKITKKVDDAEHFDKRTPFNEDEKPEIKPKGPKPYSDIPSDTEEDEIVTETSEYYKSSKTCKVKENLIQEREFSIIHNSPTQTDEEPSVSYPTKKRPQSPTKIVTEKLVRKPKSPTRDISPTRGISPQEPGRKQPTEKEPQSPKRKQQKPTDKDETFKTTLRTIKTVTEKLIQEPESPTRRVSPTRAISPNKDKQAFTTVTEKTTLICGEKPQEFETNPYKPTEIDGDKTITETTKFVIRTAQKPMHPGSQKPNEEFSTQQYPAEKPQYIKPGFVETDDDETITHTSEFTRNTSQKLITTEQQAIENTRKRSPARSPSPKGQTTPKGGPKTVHVTGIPLQTPKVVDRKLSPNRSPSPKDLKSIPKTVTVDDKTSKKLLSTTEITQFEDKRIKPEDHKADSEKPVDTDEEETTTEEHETLSTTFIKHKTQKVNKETIEPLNKPRTTEPEVKPFTSTYVETIETIEGQTYPEETEKFPAERKYSDNKKPLKAPQEPWSTQQVPTYTTDINAQFIETERVRKETPDGAFISKTTEPSTPTSPTFKKKGTGRSDTFEERCRQILGMDTYGNTPGSYKQQPSTEIDEITKIVPQDVRKQPQEDFKNTTVFQVKIEDCDEENEPLSINSVKKNLHKQIPITKEKHIEVVLEESKSGKPNEEPRKPETKRPKESLEPEDDSSDYVQKITETRTVHTSEPHIKSIDEIEPDSSETETVKEFVKTTKKSEVKITKKYSPTSSPRSSSPTKTSSSPQSVSAAKGTPQRNVSPTTETQKRKPTKASPQKLIDDTTTIKDRLRSSTRKTTSPSKLDQVDGSESSPEHSPTRYTERRRSSNISVTTEIIIEHTDSDTPSKKEKSPPITRKPKDSVFKEIIDSTVLPDKLTRRMPVTERKESAPVHRVTNRDKDSKMSRSTSENLIKVKKPEPQSVSPKGPTKTTDHRRPNKCFATKSINLSATDRLVNSEDMENVVIDIQHAKSSREPSPDKIVPTPVPAHLDTGKPRYPDVVQEPEDDHPRKKPQIKNIPIFEEEHNSYVGCHITEVNMERTHKTTYDSLDYEEQILNNPVVEAPSSLDYPSLDKPSDDESLLTVHEKVSKFQNITEVKSRPKTLQPPKKEYKGPQDDECLLNINEKVETLELVKNTEIPKCEVDEDEEFERNERIYTAVKLAPTAPQKSPELVRTISRHISRQSEPEHNNDDLVECLANNKKTTKEFKVSHHSTTESTENTTKKYQQPKEYVDVVDDNDDDHDDDELIPHTATHTTIIEERRQKDILSRPSVFDNRNKKCNKSPVKDSEKLRPDSKSRTKPTSAVTNTPTEQATANKPKQSLQRKNSDIDYELRGSNVETGVSNIISKQTKVFNNKTSSSSSNKTNDLKKITTTSNKNPEKHMPVRLTPANKSDELDLSADDEMIVSVEETTNIDIESQVVNEHLNKETSRKIPLTATTISHKKQPTAHSSTNSSPTDSPLKTKKHVVELTDKNPLKSNTVTTTSSIKTYEETVEKADDIDETVLEPTTKKSTTPHPHTKSTKMSTTTTDSVAAKRSLFESNNSSRSTTPTKRTPLTSPMSGRRPSYMDHTKSSLEHTRRDSLEINKTNYSRKPSHPEEEVTGIDRNSLVKFDVPHGKRPTTPRAASVTEEINVEEIFELEVLEKLLETVQSYEIRRRIRAQIRLIRKNQRNEMISSSTDVTTRTVKTSKVGSEEPDNITTSRGKPKPETETDALTPSTQSKEATNRINTNKKEYIFDEAYHPTTRRSPKPNRYPYEEEKQPAKKPTRSQSPSSPACKRNERHHSPDQHQYHTEMLREQSSRTTKQQHYTYEDEQELEELREIRHETSPTRKSSSPNRKPNSLHSSPERRRASPDAAYPEKTNERSRSAQTKTPQSTRVTSSRSPDSKTTATSVRKSSATYEQQETVKSSSTKPQIKRITTTTVTTTKSRPEDKTPVWADRKNILKTPQKTSSSTPDSRSGYNRTIKSTTSQKMTSNKSSFADDDCVTSSYGIGPTDENGLPLFGIRALKKKKPTMEPSETTEEVTGYVVEEKYYSDNKTKPTVERKEFIYSTNPEELQKLKEQVEVTSNKKSLKDVDVKETRQATLISKATPISGISPEDDYLDSTTKYVRRGSVKEMSEKFIQREASSTVTEKSNNYPKAGLILRTNSRKNSRDTDNENDFDSHKTRRVQQHHTSTVLADSDDTEHEYEVEEVASRHSGRFITESESECDSIKTQREFKKVSTSSSSSMATRSFLNSQGEEKVITNVSDCLERMRNADNVVEEGDTAEDQEARALLNKFLGASIIMKGAESSLPAANRQSKVISTTTTSSNLSDDNDGDNNAKHEVKTTRITKTIKSGSSSTPVTYTTCDIEEIWDEEILKELLEQARTYEERRKIRSRLRELMADREETKKSPAKGKEKEAPTAAEAANDPEEEESSASEYEEIIEEVTDYSEAESELDDKKQNNKVVVSENSQAKENISEAAVTKTEESSVTVVAKSEVTSSQPETHTEQAEETTTVNKTETETVEEVVEEISISDDKVDSSEKGESCKLMVHDKTPQPMPQEGLMHSNQSTNSKKLQTAQINSNSKETVSEGSIMQVPHNNNKTQKAAFTAPTFVRNPIVTVQTTGRADSASISNKNNNNNKNINTSRPTNSNANIYNNNDSSSGSLGGSSVVVGSGSNSPRQVDRLGVPQKEDSGTESGEDLRLIAAGLRDQLQIQSDSNIIEDVTCALSRLESSLKEGKDISVDTEKRKALLALVARLRAGLTSPEKLAEIAAAMSELDGNENLYGETSSPEADAHRSNRSRFAKRKNRNNRHTVGVSREELADARRYMEDMLLLGNISQSTTPEANSVSTNALPQWYPLEKNASSGAILTQSSTPVLRRPKQFVPEENTNTNMTYVNRLAVSNGKRRPLSGEYSVTFENPSVYRQPKEPNEPHQTVKQTSPPDDNSKFSRFTNKKHLMKRANTIDLSKTHKYNSEFDTDSDAEDKGSHLGLKRAVQVSVKKRAQNVVPPFEPKTENDRKFLAFINKQSDKPGLGWTSTRSVSNWTNKFGSIKNTFEGGLAGKPPQFPHHVSATTKSSKLFSQAMVNNSGPVPPSNHITNQQIALRLQQEAERQAEERSRKLERERLEYERRERDKLERQRQQRERQERERLEREHFERQRREQDQIAAAQHAAILREQEQFVAAKQASNNANVPKPILINEFKHAPQSVFRPIDNVDSPSKPIYKPIPQLPRNSSNWQSLNAASRKGQANNPTATSPSQYGNTRPDNSFITSPPPSSRSPIALPWALKPTVDSSDFKSKAHRFEERSKYDNINNAGPYIQRHNSLRSSNGTSNPISDDFRKRPSLPNTCEPYSVRQMPSQQDPLAYLPPPQNISFSYSNLRPKNTYQSYPCLPSAVVSNSSENNYQRSRDDSLTDPHSVPLVLTSSNPSYCPPAQDSPQQQQQLSQPRLPRQFDLASPADSMPTSPSIYAMPQADCTDDDLDSDYNLLEYHAVSRVMRKPQSQTAVTVGRRTGHVSDDELYGKNSRAAKTLLNTMKSLGNSNGIAKTKPPLTKRSETVTSPKTCLSPDGRSYQAPIVEPLFPEINKFEANRKPLYMEDHSKQAAALSQHHSAPRKQMGLYKSMENLNRTTVKNLTNFNQQPSPNPYVSETQTSYVVTFPVDDTTDDEEFSRLGQNRVLPPNNLSLRRQRNVSENSTGSSTTASISYSQNLPSPNTSWTSNPIVGEESSNFPNKPTSYQNTNNVLPPATAEPTWLTASSQEVKNYSTVNQNYNTPNDSIKKAAQYEAPPHKQVPQQQPPKPYNAPATQPPSKLTQTASTTTSKSSYEAKSQRQLQQQQPQYQNTTNQKQMPQQVLEKQQKPSITQKPTDNQKPISKISTTTSITQEKRTLATIRKAISEDYPNKQCEEPTKINPQHSNISQEMLIRLEQQRERISNDTRRKSLGNTLDFQLEKQARFETQQTQEYKSSAPSNTPDIVKSSLPKDESQPILKKFGPPQRHHYMPNSYQSPSANTTSSSVVATSTHSTKIQGKQILSTSNHTVVKSSQQILNNTRPTVMETPATPQPDDDYIPRNIVFNNIHAFTSMTRRQDDEVNSLNREQHQAIRPNKLSKSDSWNQIIMLQNKQSPTHTTKFNPSPTNELRRTKSGHTLALPKMYEAAMTKTDISEKQKTVAAYFTGQKSPTQQETVVEQQITKRSVINRTKTSEKVSAASRKSLGSNLPIAPGGLQRSATMPHIANLNFLDETNVDDAFEQLIMEQKQQKHSSSTTEKTETKEKDGAVVTTTTKVTTRTVTGSAAKPVSPFAKFQQLDKSYSQSAKSPITPTTPGGGSTASATTGNQPIFKFTDPALNAKAATVKEQLLQWCQSKTQEYENIEITNFSTSWNNGLAFCALIHHFLPDAFDYSQLTPKNRRKNFELAFTVADEKAGIAPLLDVEDMVVMQRPDWKCVFVYVQSIYRRFRNCQ